MNSLVSYGSDDNSDDSADDRFPEMPGRPTMSVSKNYRKPASHEDNYEEVGMDMSEDSDDSTGPERQDPKSSQTSKPGKSSNSSNHQQPSATLDHKSSSSAPQQSGHRSGSRSPKHRREDERRNSRAEDRGREDRVKGGDDRYRKRDERSSRDSKDEDRSKKDDDKGRGRHRNDRRDRRDDRYNRDRRDRRRSRSRDRRRSSRSPKRSPKSPRRTSRSPRRSRSGSRDRGSRAFPSRREKADKRMDRLGKLGIEFKPDSYPASAIEEAERNSKMNTGGDRFFMPGITGRFREQIEKRKLLWQKSKEQDNAAPAAPKPVVATNIVAASGSKASKVYEATTFADDKTSNKFKRLMGIKETADVSSLPVKSTDVLKKQQEMFTSMEAQYEVARTATHTMRGVGLGFGSFQR